MGKLLYETQHFTLETAEPPHVYVSREEGGHIKLKCKLAVSDRTKLNVEQAIEYMKLSMLAGAALRSVLTEAGIEVGLINYQEMGNWSVFKPGGPVLHMHIFGRATTATVQKYGEAVALPRIETGFYQHFQPLTEQDVMRMRTLIASLESTEPYCLF